MNTHNNEQKDFAENILKKISEEHIVPRSKISVVFHHILLWTPWTVVTLIGIVGVAGIFFSVAYAGWEYREFVHPSPLLYAFQTISLIWIACFGVFALVVIKAFRVTSRGYRRSPLVIIGVSLLVSILGGFLVYIGDREVLHSGVLSAPTEGRQRALWSNPAFGKIMGEVQVNEKGETILRDSYGTTWILNLEEIESTLLAPGSIVRLVGIPKAEGVFVACKVFPWEFSSPSLKRRPQIVPSLQYEKMQEISCKDITEYIKRMHRERKVLLVP